MGIVGREGARSSNRAVPRCLGLGNRQRQASARQQALRGVRGVIIAFLSNLSWLRSKSGECFSRWRRCCSRRTDGCLVRRGLGTKSLTHDRCGRRVGTPKGHGTEAPLSQEPGSSLFDDSKDTLTLLRLVRLTLRDEQMQRLTGQWEVED